MVEAGPRLSDHGSASVILTTLTILLGTALAAEAGFAAHSAIRREPWEPSIVSSFNRRETDWQLVGTTPVSIFDLKNAVTYDKRDWLFDELVAERAKEQGIEYHHYSIDWLFGCIDPETNERKQPGWERHRAEGWANIFFYKEPIPEPKPLPEPVVQVPQQSSEETVQKAIAFMRHESAFWLAPDYSGGSNLRDKDTSAFWERDPAPPVLRYTRDKTVLAEEHDGIERYADLEWSASRKNHFKVIYDDPYFKPTYHANYRSAMIAIFHFFEKCFGEKPQEFANMVRWHIGLAVLPIHSAETERHLSKEHVELMHRLSNTGLTVHQFAEIARSIYTHKQCNDLFSRTAVSHVEGPYGRAQFTAHERNELLIVDKFLVDMKDN